jgi:hypothetical protein
MADNELKRYPTKYLRDYCKSKYNKGSKCEICGTTENLHFHHFYTISVLVNNWFEKHKTEVTTPEQAFEWRVVFENQHKDELYIHAATLCKDHHEKLHSIYGKNPVLATAPKQARWVQRMKEKHGKLEILG